jgi:hypothetical protein
MTAAVQKIIEEIKALSPSERREVEAALHAAPSSEDDLDLYLVSKGLVALPEHPHQPLPDIVPIQIKGEPLSETIIRERR